MRQVEMAVSVDPDDPDRQVIAVTRPGSNVSKIRAWWTADGGRTWSETIVRPPTDGAFAGTTPYSDPAVTHDDQGNVHVVYLLNPRCCDGSDPCGCPVERAIIAAKSTDGGATYTSTAVSDLALGTLDKPWVAADREPGSPGFGNLYVVWSENDDSRSYVARSEDRGDTWPASSRQEFATSSFFAGVAVGPGGQVYTIWFTWGQGDRKITFRNLGVEANAFQAPVTIADIADGYPVDGNPAPALAASPRRPVYSVPSVAVDLSGGPHRGRVWVAYTDYTDSGDPERMNVYVRWSDDEGATWSTPVEIGDPDSAQFLPWISVDPTDGSVGIVYYSTEDDDVAPRDGTHVYHRALWDGLPSVGSHWVPRRLSATISTPSDDGGSGEDYREYIGLDERHDAGHVSWTSRHLGLAQMMYTRVHSPLTQSTSGATDETGDNFGKALAAGDFDGDGYGDLAIGAPTEDDQATDDGFVVVHFGGPDGPGTRDRERFNQTAAGLASESGDLFGAALAAGDFDGDGFDDLAVGVPEEDGVSADEGAIVVFHGSANGLLPADTDAIDQGTLGLDRGTNDRFGASLVSGDFDGDGFDDLAVGSPTEDDLAFEDGNVIVLYGSSSGLRTSGYERLRQSQAGMTEADSDEFGETLAAADLDDDGFDDLAVGVPLRDDEATDSGNVVVFYGSSGGLLPADTERLSQPDAGRPSENGDRFGGSLASADFDGDGFPDLAVGVPDEFQNAPQDGAVIVYYGSAAGLLPATTELLLQTRGGETMETDDRFGAALAAGDLDGDGYGDLAVAIPGEDFVTTDDGTVIAFYGSPDGLLPARADLIRQADAGGAPEVSDRFADTLVIADLNGDCRDDLVAGVPGEDLSGATNAGAVLVLAGARGGVLAEPRARIPGDVDCDGCVDYADRERILDGLGAPNRCGTDVNGDGTVDSLDLDVQQAFCGQDDGVCTCADGDCDGYGTGGSSTCALGTKLDCADGDPDVHGTPGEVRSLVLDRTGTTAELGWSPPSNIGGDAGSVGYDVLRSANPADFAGAAVCVESDDASDTSATDPGVPASGVAFHYLVRAGNTCGDGPLGNASSGARSGRACP